MGRVIEFRIECDVFKLLREKIKYHEDSAIDYIQEYDDEEQSNINQAKADAYKELLGELQNKIDISGYISGKIHEL